MPTKQRYHLHICLVRNEDIALENALQVALSDDFFLSWDLIGSPTELNNFSRHQIDSCDYLLLILGDSYGAVGVSGVSALHLSYIYATTKRRPMLSLIKSELSTHPFSRQRNDLAALIDKEANQQMPKPIYYHEWRDALVNFRVALDNLLKEHPKPAWLYPGMVAGGSEAVIMSSPVTPKPAPDHGLKSAGAPSAVGMGTPIKTATTAAMQLDFPQPARITDEPVIVDYSAHAFQDGNLHTIIGTHIFVWADLLNVLKTLVPPFSTDMLQRRLNDSLKDVAMQEASKNLPNVHAVSRCQINATEMQWLKTQLVNNNWLLKASDTRGTRELWQLHPALD